MARLLIVDDEKGIRDALTQVFEYEGQEVRVAEDGPDAILISKEFQPDIVFLDVKMPGMDGIEVLARLEEESPGSVIIMISGHGTIDTALEATRIGAYDFLEKPLDTDRLLVTFRRALELKGLTKSMAELRSQVESQNEIVGASRAIRRVLELVEKVSPTDARVLISGENGTGKELVAHAIHRLSERSETVFIEVNCAAIPSELIESELFGHMRGSFTGAVADRAGKFEQADGGTLFLDEIGDMSANAQAKVLRVLEQGVLTRIGGSEAIKVDVRVLSATNKNLEKEIHSGRFREDLFYRLNVVPIRVPPLRERKEDIPMLVTHFSERMADREKNVCRVFSDGAIESLKTLAWPGNVRELRNTVERLLILSDGIEVKAAHVEALATSRGRFVDLATELLAVDSFADFKERAEREYIIDKLQVHNWNVAETARQIDMPRSNLYKKIEKYGLVREA